MLHWSEGALFLRAGATVAAARVTNARVEASLNCILTEACVI